MTTWVLTRLLACWSSVHILLCKLMVKDINIFNNHIARRIYAMIYPACDFYKLGSSNVADLVINATNVIESDKESASGGFNGY